MNALFVPLILGSGGIFILTLEFISKKEDEEGPIMGGLGYLGLAMVIVSIFVAYLSSIVTVAATIGAITVSYFLAIKTGRRIISPLKRTSTETQARLICVLGVYAVMSLILGLAWINGESRMEIVLCLSGITVLVGLGIIGLLRRDNKSVCMETA